MSERERERERESGKGRASFAKQVAERVGESAARIRKKEKIWKAKFTKNVFAE